MVRKITEEQLQKTITLLYLDKRFSLETESDSLCVSWYFVCKKGLARCLLVRFNDGRCYIA